jgi:predicted ATPase
MAVPGLPLQPTPFVGRVDELAEIAALLVDPACRLLTLVGPGGIGKTRLALQAAADAQSHFADGVCFVALQPVTSTEFLVQAFADALHLAFYGTETPRLQLLRWLRPQQRLIVVDNFEHLLDDVALLTEIMEAAPGVKLLVTSRETLNVREEWVREVRGMRVPGDDQIGEPDSYDAVQLFVARARQALRHEVEYHRPQARWAQHLLKLLARYEAHPHRTKPPSSATVMAKHIAWQERRLSAVAHG